MYRCNNFAHSVPTMVALAKTTEDFLSHLPAEFTKKDFDTARKLFAGHPLSLPTCREYGFVVVVRTEPAPYFVEEDVWTSPVTGRQYNFDEMRDYWSKGLAKEFGIPYEKYLSPYNVPGEQKVKRERQGFRNYFAFDVEKFKRFVEKNA